MVATSDKAFFLVHRALSVASVIVFLLNTSAYAQFYEYQPQKPSVEIDMQSLESPSPLPAPASTPVTVSPPPAPRPLLKPFFTAPNKLREEMQASSVILPTRKPETLQESAPKEQPSPPVLLPPEAVVKPEQKPMILPGPEEKSADGATPRNEPPELPMTWKSKIAQNQMPSSPPPPPADSNAVDATLAFLGNDSALTPETQTQLDQIVAQMKIEQSTRLQVRAYATGEDDNKGSARRIALARALTIRSYLMEQDINPSRIDVRALGSETHTPLLDRVDVLFVK